MHSGLPRRRGFAVKTTQLQTSIRLSRTTKQLLVISIKRSAGGIIKALSVIRGFIDDDLAVTIGW